MIDRSLTDVRLRVNPKIYLESLNLLRLIDQIFVTANIEAKLKNQVLDIQIHPDLMIRVDYQLMYSAVSNLIQNAIKYSKVGGKIRVLATTLDKVVSIKVEDECGGLSGSAKDLFRPFEQQSSNRSGLGLGLTIAERAIKLNNGSLTVESLPHKGCIFTITIPIAN